MNKTIDSGGGLLTNPAAPQKARDAVIIPPAAPARQSVSTCPECGGKPKVVLNRYSECGITKTTLAFAEHRMTCPQTGRRHTCPGSGRVIVGNGSALPASGKRPAAAAMQEPETPQPFIPRFMLLLRIDGVVHQAEAVRDDATNRVLGYEIRPLGQARQSAVEAAVEPDVITVWLQGPARGNIECNCAEYAGKTKPHVLRCRHIDALRVTGVLRDDESMPPIVPAA